MHEKAEDYECVCKGKEPYEVLKTKWLSYGEICRLKGIEDMVEVYYNSGQFSHTMKAVERHFIMYFLCMKLWQISMNKKDIRAFLIPE